MMFLSLFSLALADEGPTFTPEAQVRPRLEAHSGRDGVAGTRALAFSHRARLGGTLARGPVSLHLVVQDVRIWGEETHTLKDFSANGLDLHVASIDWRPEGLPWVRVGRQEVGLQEHRLVGTVGWTQQGRSLDGIRVGHAGSIWDLDLGAFVLKEGDLDPDTEGDAALALLRAGWVPENGRVDFVAVHEHDRPGDLDRLTTGFYAKGSRGQLSGRAEGYVQVGQTGDQTIRAAMIGLQGTLTVPVAQAPKVTLWADWLSGDADGTDGLMTTFAAPYATNHKFYGFADIASFSQAGWADGRGLIDLAARGSVAIGNGTTVALDAHTFVLPVASDTRLLAEEIDVWASHQLAPGLKLWGGAAVWLPRADASPDLWAVVQLDAKL